MRHPFLRGVKITGRTHPRVQSAFARSIMSMVGKVMSSKVDSAKQMPAGSFSTRMARARTLFSQVV